jgi:hypothetical protein
MNQPRHLYKIGDHVININAITYASYDPAAEQPCEEGTWQELAVSFGCDDSAFFYGLEAVQLWGLLTSHLYCHDITPAAPVLEEVR